MKEDKLKTERKSNTRVPSKAISTRMLAVNELDLSFSKLGDDGTCTLLQGLSRNKFIKKLSIAGNCVTSGIVPDLKRLLLSGSPLVSLNLSYNALTLYGVSGLEEALKENKVIRNLDFSYNRGIRDPTFTLKVLQRLLSWNEGLDIVFIPVLKVTYQ